MADRNRQMRAATKRVLLAISTTGSDGHARLAGIYRWLGEGHDWDEIILRTRADFTVHTIENLVRYGLDGAIVSIPYNHDAGKLLVEARLPIVVMTSALTEQFPAERPNTDFSLIDNIAIGRAAAAHFRTLGRFATYAYLHDARTSDWSNDRLAGFASIHPDCQVFSGHRESDNTIDRLNRKELIDFISALTHPAALLAANDIIAEQVLSVCRELAIRVPDDLSILGVDNDVTTCTASRPTISSIEPDFNEAGYRAASILDSLMNCRKPRKWSKRPGVARIITRGSTKPLAPATKLILDALAFIDANVFSNISAADVISHLRVSRSLANLRFRELTGSSIGEALKKRRLAECERLLRTTDWSFHRISDAVGYSNPDVLRNLFRAHHGIGPTRWRVRAEER